jgi:hypothetical protein
MKEFILFLALANPVTFKLLKGVFGEALANSYGRPTLLGLFVAAGLFVLLMNYTRISKFNPFSADSWEEEVGNPIVSGVGTPLVNAYNTSAQWVDQFGNSCNALTAIAETSVMAAQNGPGPD